MKIVIGKNPRALARGHQATHLAPLTTMGDEGLSDVATPNHPKSQF